MTPSALWRAAALLGLEPDDADPAVAQDIVSIDPRVAFRHPLIRSAVYEGARPGDRRRVHKPGEHRWAGRQPGRGGLAPRRGHRGARRGCRGGPRALGGAGGTARRLRCAGHVPDPVGRAHPGPAGPCGAAIRRSPGLSRRRGRCPRRGRSATWRRPGPAEAGLHVAAQRLRGLDRRVLLPAQRRPQPPAGHRRRRCPRNCATTAGCSSRRYRRHWSPASTPSARLPRRWPAPRCRHRGTRAWTRQLPTCCWTGFATRIAVGYPQAVPLLRAAVQAFSASDQPTPAGIPGTILGQFAADDLWDDQGRRAMLRRAEAVHRGRGALGALRVNPGRPVHQRTMGRAAGRGRITVLRGGRDLRTDRHTAAGVNPGCCWI